MELFEALAQALDSRAYSEILAKISPYGCGPTAARLWGRARAKVLGN